MPLHGADALLGYARNFRCIWIGGRMGGGKTALAFRLAHDLVTSGSVHYVLSNIPSVWNTDPRDVVLRDGKYVDAVLVLDEGGLFLDGGHITTTFLSYLRKLNIVLLVPSVKPPATSLRFVTVQRVFDSSPFFIPAWWYTVQLKYGGQNDKGRFTWRNPSEIFGVYDTQAMPEDADDLYTAFKCWIAAARTTLETERAQRPSKRRQKSQSAQPAATRQDGHATPDSQRLAQADDPRTALADSLSVEQVARLVDAIHELQADLSNPLPVHEHKRRRR